MGFSPLTEVPRPLPPLSSNVKSSTEKSPVVDLFRCMFDESPSSTKDRNSPAISSSFTNEPKSAKAIFLNAGRSVAAGSTVFSRYSSATASKLLLTCTVQFTFPGTGRPHINWSSLLLSGSRVLAK